jgi:Asp/Glu/hydantoin racemase
MNRKVTLIHTSPAAITPLAQFYGATAPELELTNLLDDGLLRLFRNRDTAAAQARLADMIRAARVAYEAEVVLLTCSAIPGDVLRHLRATAGVPVLKIDEPMARAAVRAGGTVGVVVTFAPTLEPTCALLREAAAEAGVAVELRPEVLPDAYQALLAGDAAAHDARLLDAVLRLEALPVSAIVLAQVSMARALPRLEGRTRVPVFTSLHTSLAAVREALGCAIRDVSPDPAGAGVIPESRCAVRS